MATSTASRTGVLMDAARDRGRAEFREVVAMLNYRDAEMERTSFLESPMRRQIERSAIVMSIAEATGLSECQVQSWLSAADTVCEQSPITWSAFRDGMVDLARVRDIAHTINILQRAESVHRLDARLLDFAVDHTAAELRGWLRRFVQRVEGDLAVDRAETERARRHVSVSHTHDGMGWLKAYLTSHELAAIGGRVRKQARRPADPGDDRTVAQREADLLVAWCTGSDAATSPIDANIAVTIDADVLAGAVAGFAQSSDGRWGVPAGWITDLARTGTSSGIESCSTRSTATFSPTSISAGSAPTSSTLPCSSATTSARPPDAWSPPAGATWTTGSATPRARPTPPTWARCADVTIR